MNIIVISRVGISNGSVVRRRMRLWSTSACNGLVPGI